MCLPQVLSAAAGRLQDYEEKVRLAAVKAVCQACRHLLVGPQSSTAAPTGPSSANPTALLSPVDILMGSAGSQEAAEAAAADLDLTTAADLQGSPGPAAAAAAARELPFVHDALRHVNLRLRDTKLSVRKAAANQFLSIFRAVVAAGGKLVVVGVGGQGCSGKGTRCTKHGTESQPLYLMRCGPARPCLPSYALLRAARYAWCLWLV